MTYQWKLALLFGCALIAVGGSALAQKPPTGCSDAAL
jgi:hypothetical protein